LVNIIIKKRDKLKLSEKEIKSFVDGYVSGAIPDYQMAAMLMAIYLNDMDEEETLFLTKAMLYSGDLIDLSAVKDIVIDKHSTGGVGDKTSIILAPLVAAAGIPVAKMSGRGLSHTGGTIDKLEAIPGFKAEMSLDQFVHQVNSIGVALTGQTGNLVPADKKIYALRDVTGTVSHLSLIASSIMSKKLASGANGIVIDLKVGDGAFIKNLADAEKLASIMIKTANGMQKPLSAALTSMQQPLGNAIGNAIEIKESIEILKGNGPNDLYEVTMTLATEMLLLSGKYHDQNMALQVLKELIDSGKALAKCKEWIQWQGGDPKIVDHPELLPTHTFSYDYRSKESGYIQSIKASNLGLASMKLGAGRERKEDILDMGAGIYLYKKVGNHVEKGEILASLFTNKEELIPLAIDYLESAYQISPEKPEIQPLIYKIIR
jgi:pyrimidine-nucleoside phosphorylase